MWFIILVIIAVMMYFFTGFTIWGLLCAGWFAFFKWIAENLLEGFLMGLCYVIGAIPFIFLTIAYPIPALPIIGIILLVVGVSVFSEYRDNVKKQEEKKAKELAEKRFKEEQKMRRTKLLNDFKQTYALPLPANWEIVNDNMENVVDKYVKLLSGVDINNKRELFELKLKAFYDVSVAAECEQMNLESPFDGLTNTSSLMRQGLHHDSPKVIEEMISTLNGCLKQLDNDNLTPYGAQLKSVNKQQTSFFGMSEKDKTEKMHKIYKNAKAEFEELLQLTNQLNTLLGIIRMYAYKNIHLGAELLNYERENSGGKSLTTEKSIADIANIKFHNLNINSISLEFHTIKSFATGALSTLDAIASSRSLSKFATNNPKTTGLIMVIEGVGNMLEERKEAIENNIRMQKKMVEQFGKMIDQYVKCKAEMVRGIEIAKAIINANRGFMHTYEPLRDKVFTSQQPLTMDDMQALALATSEYKKISMSKL